MRAVRLDRDVGGEAAREDPEIERPRRVAGGKIPPLGVIEGLDRAEAGDAGAGEAKLGVLAVHRERRVAILERIDRDAEGAPFGATLQLADARRLGAIDEILDRLDLGERGEAAECGAGAVGNDAGRGEGVVEQAAVRIAAADRADAGDIEIGEARVAAVDPRERLGELGPEVGGRDVERAAGRLEQELAPAERCEPPARGADALDQRGCLRGQRILAKAPEQPAGAERADAERGKAEKRPTCRH